jgi:hypothetical protein
MADMLMKPEPVDLVVLAKDGRLLELNNCIGLKFDKYKGTRRIKMLASGEIRTIRDILVIKINGCEVMI